MALSNEFTDGNGTRSVVYSFYFNGAVDLLHAHREKRGDSESHFCPTGTVTINVPAELIISPPGLRRCAVVYLHVYSKIFRRAFLLKIAGQILTSVFNLFI